MSTPRREPRTEPSLLDPQRPPGGAVRPPLAPSPLVEPLHRDRGYLGRLLRGQQPLRLLGRPAVPGRRRRREGGPELGEAGGQGDNEARSRRGPRAGDEPVERVEDLGGSHASKLRAKRSSSSPEPGTSSFSASGWSGSSAPTFSPATFSGASSL